MTIRMRVALKVAYDGRAFSGHQRQPDARTVEGECLLALRSAKIMQDPKEAFFRSASRTDRGVSALGNVIAFNTAFQPDDVVGAFNDRARDVWAWAVAEVPDSFHPRHALQRWYRYHLFSEIPLSKFRDAAALFVGSHDFRSFTSDPKAGPMAIDRVAVLPGDGVTLLDVYARSFRRGMVRRIVAAIQGLARGLFGEPGIRAALAGALHDFGAVGPDPLFLMDVRYRFTMEALLKPKVLEEWRARHEETELRARFDEGLKDIVRAVAPSSATNGRDWTHGRPAGFVGSG
jgi:tRNA pseudouridine38-40 synthase